MRQLKEFYQYKRNLKVSKFLLKDEIISNPFLGADLKVFSPTSLNILYINSSLNNTIISLTTLKGKVILNKSCGSLGFKGKKKRRTKFAIESTLDNILSVIKDLGSSKILLCLNGFVKARFSIISLLKKKKLKILGVRDITSIPHNGCRSKKLRRG